MCSSYTCYQEWESLPRFNFLPRKPPVFFRCSLLIGDSARQWSVTGRADGVRPDVVVTMSALFSPRPGRQSGSDLAHQSLITLQTGQGSSFTLMQTGAEQSVHVGQSAESQMLTNCLHPVIVERREFMGSSHSEM